MSVNFTVLFVVQKTYKLAFRLGYSHERVQKLNKNLLKSIAKKKKLGNLYLFDS